jgi:hypothetical protein
MDNLPLPLPLLLHMASNSRVSILCGYTLEVMTVSYSYLLFFTYSLHLFVCLFLFFPVYYLKMFSDALFLVKNRFHSL